MGRRSKSSGGAGGNALQLHENNGRITCAEACNHGIAHDHRDYLAYQYYLRDGDGVVCE